MEHDQQPKETGSFKPLTVSSTPSQVSTTTDQDHAILKIYAAERSRLLFGCYRKGEANDPDTYVAAITAVLSRYPRDVIRTVTHPAKGLPVRTNFLPTVKEVFDACEEIEQPRREAEARKKRTEKQIAERAELERPIYPPGSQEARAVKVMHDIVGRTTAFFQIFRRGDGSVTYTKSITEQLKALSQAMQQDDWVALNHQQAGAWEALMRTVFPEGLIRTRIREGSKAPWPWPPSVDGKIYTDAGGPPPITQDDIDALASEGQR